MTRLRSLILTASVLFITASGGAAAFAHDNDRSHYNSSYNNNSHYNNNGQRHGSYHQHGKPNKGYDRDYNYWSVNLSQYERRDLSRQLDEAYRYQCRNVARNRYYNCGRSEPIQIGRKLPPSAVNWNIPGHIAKRLPRSHPDTRYVWVDRDILLVSRWDGTVLDRVVSVW